MIGLNNLNNGNYHQAYDALRKSYIYSGVDDIPTQFLAQQDILMGTSLMNLDSNQLAITYFDNARFLAPESSLIECYAVIGLTSIYNEEGEQDSILLYKTDLEKLISDSSLDPIAKVDVYQTLADIYFRQYNLAGHGDMYEEFLNIRDTSRLYHRYIDSRLSLQNRILSSGNKSLVEGFTDHKIIRNEWRSQENTNFINSWKIKYDTELKEKENEILKADNNSKASMIKSQRYLVILFALGMLLVSSLAYIWNNRQKAAIAKAEYEEKEREYLQVMNEELSLSNEELKQVNDDLESRVREFAPNDIDMRIKLNGLQSKLHIVDPSEVAFVKAKSDGANLNFKDGARIWVNHPIKDILDKFPSSQFVQCFRGVVVNVVEIKEMTSSSLILKSGVELKLSRSFKENFR